MAGDVLAPFPESMAWGSPVRLHSLAARYLDSVAEAFPGAEFVTDKRPDNFAFIMETVRLRVAEKDMLVHAADAFDRPV